LHSKIYRVSDVPGADPIFHGQRILCSKRRGKNGCGKTFALNLTIKLPRLNRFTAKMSNFLLHYIASPSAFVAWCLVFPFCVDICQPFRFARHIKKAYLFLNAFLCSLTKPPDKPKPNTIKFFAHHLHSAFPDSKNPLENLILLLQKRPF